MWHPKPAHTSDILYTAREIAAYLRVHHSAVYRLRDRFGLPVAHMPSGVLMTSRQAIDRWIIARARQQSRERMKGRNGAHPGRSRRNPAAD